MASGSGKNQDDTETKEPDDLLREQESNAAAHSATEPPPSTPQSEIVEEQVHGPQEDRGRDPSTAAAAAAERKGRGSAGGKPPLHPRRPSVSRARGPSSAARKAPRPRAPPAPPAPLSREEVIAGGMAVREKWRSDRENRVDMKDLFEELMLDCQRSRETDQKSEAEGTPRQQNEDEQVKSLAVWHKKDKKQLWRKFFNRIGIAKRNYTVPHVNYQKLHITEMIRHYNLLEMVAGRGVEFDPHALNLRRDYSEFRPVHGDGECFYRSFIFSYLEQVLDRQDTHEEHRLLAAVKGVARQHARLGRASEFSRSHKAFKKLIKKVMRWKTHRPLKHVPTTNSYRIEKLLEFFSNYKRTDHIFTFLRLVAAIWICSHSEEFEPLIPDLNEGYTLTAWCFEEVIQRKVFTDHIQITALVRALQVPLRVEYLFQEAGQDLYIGQDSQDDHEVPRVTMLYTQEHYDILYLYHPDSPVTSGESSGQQSDKIESPATKSPSQYQKGSCSGETSSQQIDRVEGSTSTGEKSNQHTAQGGNQSNTSTD